MVQKKSAEPRAEIEGSEPLNAPSDLHLEEDDEEAVDGKDDEDVPVELPRLVVTGVDKAGSTHRGINLWEMR